MQLSIFTFEFIFLQMKKLYSWHDVARRTEIVYDRALRFSSQPLLERLSQYAIVFHISEYSAVVV